MTPASARTRTDLLLSVRGLDVCRRQVPVVRDVPLTIGAEPITVAGRNGMGKTTLCEALVGLLPVRNGTVRVDGHDISGRRPFHIARAGIGYVPQRQRIFAFLTGG